ncbi:MAG: restriction endonuclease [Thaumarchaeota archaeon]|nr:restriction endonuclease [Nitrososphaerota archaeon]
MLDLIENDLLDVSAPEGIARNVWKSSLAFVKSHGMGQTYDGKLQLKSSDRVRIAMLAAPMVQDLRKVSQKLGWRDFELFVSEVAEHYGYHVKSNLIIAKPRVQIDLIAVKGTMCIAIDCKHWGKSAGVSSLSVIAKRQIRRAKILLRSDEAKSSNVKTALPAIVTLLPSLSRTIAGVPVVPVSEINNFFANVDGYIGDYKVIRRRERIR